MRRQSSTSNSVPELSNNLGTVQHNVVSENAPVNGGRPVTRWMGQSSSSVNTLDEATTQEILAEFGWPPPIGARTGNNQMLEETHPEPTRFPFSESVNMNLSDSQDTTLPPVLQTASSGALPHTIDLNATYEGNGSENLLSDARRLSCKRRATENASGQLSLGESSNFAQQAGNSEEEVVPVNANSSLTISAPLNNPPIVNHHPPQQFGTRVGFGMIGGNVPGMQQSSNGAGQTENFRRNIRVRRTANVQDYAPADISSGGTTRNSPVQSPNQAAVLYPFGRFSNLRSTAEPFNATRTIQSYANVPNAFRALQPTSWIQVTGPRAGASSSRNTPASIPEHNQIVPENGMMNMTHNLANLGFANGNTSFPGIVASASRNGPSSGVHPSSAPALFPQRNLAEQYAHPETVNRSMTIPVGHETGGEGSNRRPRPDASAPVREMDSSARAGNARRSPMDPRLAFMANVERQAGGYTDSAPVLRNLTAAERRSRLVSQVRTALALVRRGGSIHFEDVMIIDNTVVLGLPAEPDIHQDMRLDVDNMSYEELLALEEHIGNVSTGLNEEAILGRLGRGIHQSLAIGTPVEDAPCCICQEEYDHGEELGKLDCGHDFHFSCIKQWLLQKNSCPICKKKALEF